MPQALRNPLRGIGHNHVDEFVPKNMMPMISPARAGLRRMRLTRALAMVLLAASLGACTSLFGKDDTPPDEPADRLYNEGLYYLNAKKDPKAAIKKFEEVDRQHPYSEWARKSLIMASYSYYESGQYDECVSAAKRYISLHPGSADAAYAQYLIGASYFDEIPDITRDQARTEKAMACLLYTSDAADE